ncbi:MAG TPA: hypothetical protein VGI20_14325 [Rhizomicrobium sp.]|jgi:hypothetical protein
MTWSWDEMIEAFRALGGTADNIVQRQGALGRGIFPADGGKPIRLLVPKNLLIPVDDIEFVDHRLKIRDSTIVGEPERNFCEKYENIFSWGGEGRADSVAFITALDGLPAEVRSELSAAFSKFESGAGDSNYRAQRWFLHSRMIHREGKFYVMPIMELVNHDPSARTYDLKEGVAIEGTFSGEVFVRYSLQDPFGMFRTFGFASPEPMAFSMPMTEGDHPRLVINTDYNFNFKRGSFYVPEFKLDGDALTLSCMMIGNSRFPRFSRGAFNAVMREAGQPNSNEMFDLILHRNRSRHHRLLAALEPYDGELIRTLRKAVRLQLEAMSHCIGAREL